MKKQRQLILSVGTVLVMAMILLACGGTEDKEYVEEGETAETGELSILSHNMSVEYDGWSYYHATVTGQAKNIGDAMLSHASVSVKFYDSYGALLATSSDYISDLDAGEVWNFEVTHMDETETASYTIAVGSCW